MTVSLPRTVTKDSLYLIAAMGGLALALWSALGAPVPDGRSFPGRGNGVDGGPAAFVDGHPISRLDYERALGAVAADRRSALSAADRVRILDTLIAEELLLNRAIDLDLVRYDADLRKAAIAAAMRSVQGAGRDDPPTEAELEAFYRDTPGLLSPRPLMRVQHVFAKDAAAAKRLADIIKRTSGEAIDPEMLFSKAAKAHGGEFDSRLPDHPLDEDKLADYLGRSLAQMATHLPSGAVAGPLETGGGFHFLWIRERQDPGRPEFASVRSTVEAEWQRRRDEARLRDLIAELRQGADIRVMEGLAP